MPAFGSSRLAHLLALAFACLLSHVSAVYSQASCPDHIGRIVSLQGDVQVQRAHTSEWVGVKSLDLPLCIGDQIRTGLLSRAGLYISPETIVRLDQNTTLEFVEQTAEQTVVALRREEFNRVVEKRAGQCGVGYFITRFPRKLKVRTPFYNAVIEGTEFQVAMSCDRGELAVFEGKVVAEKLDAPSERVLVEGGQSTAVGAGERPAAIKTLVRPADAVQWALYYLPLSDVKLLAEDALAQDCASIPAELRSNCAIRKAEYLLKVGRVAEARAQLDALATAEPNNGDVLALLSIIALVQNDKSQALDLATRATHAAPNAFRSFAALSYAQQAHFKLEDALAAAQRAAQLAPDSALMKARTAELQLSLGKTRAAERDAKEAVRLDPNESRAHLILGFVHLAQIDTKAAKADFGKAIELDSTEPLARLGLGLATIREGKLQEGREQIEIAVVLDPTNSLVRSYVGKAYYEENSKARDQLAATQFGLAKVLDPKDPTPWFYDAILKQTQNRPAEALQDLQQSIALNDNRAVYRSKLALDQDRSSRAINLAQSFSATGASAEALGLASESVSRSPDNAGAHRFLSDFYAARDRHEVGRTSELLQAQLLQSIDAPFLSPRLAYTNVDVPGQSRLNAGDLEYSRLFERPGISMSLSGALGTQDSQGGEVIAAVRSDRAALSFAGFGYTTSGFRPNNDLKHEIYDVFGMVAPTSTLSLQAEYRKRRSSFGDIVLNFDPEVFDPFLHRTIDQETGRLGLALRPSLSSTVLLSAIWSSMKEAVHAPTPGVVDLTIGGHDRGGLYEAQYQFIREHFNVVGGVGYSEAESKLRFAFDWTTPSFPFACLPPLLPCESIDEGTVRQQNVYAYVHAFPIPAVQLTIGGSYDNFRDVPTHVEGFHPKLGAQVQLSSAWTVRAAYFQVLKRQLAVDQTIEPTQVAGFMQLYDDPNGSESKSRAFAVDFAPAKTFRVSGELLRRDIDISGALFGTGLAAGSTETFREETAKLSFNWLATGSVSMLGGAEYDEFTWDPVTISPTTLPVRIFATKVPIGVRYFATNGFFGELIATTVRQTVRRVNSSSLPEGSDNFTVVDLVLGWRLPARRGLLSLEVKNLFDTKFSYQDDNFRATEIRLSPFIPERRLWLKGTLWF